jgi:hypothetical protein
LCFSEIAAFFSVYFAISIANHSKQSPRQIIYRISNNHNIRNWIHTKSAVKSNFHLNFSPFPSIAVRTIS